MNRAGELVNNLSGDAAYKSFKPSALPPKLNIDNDMLKKLVEANRDLIRLDTAAKLIPGSELFISMYVRKEALISSQIEGTQCTLDDVLDPKLDTNANLDVADVVNYVKACSYAIERLEKLPLCKRLFREIHGQLLSGVRGQENPGEFRRSQNWIGAANCSLKEARFIPPNVDDMNQAMDELELYMNESDDYDPLIRISLIHYQFETIHPFLDGNGRVGRLLILLYLMQQGLISKPIIYISYFLKKIRSSIMTGFQKYEEAEIMSSGYLFLEAVSAAAKDSLDTVEKLNALHEQNVKKLPKTSRSNDNVRKLFDYIEQFPIIDIKKTSEAFGISYNTVSSAIKKLEQIGILKQTTNASRNRVFSYEDYLHILRKDT